MEGVHTQLRKFEEYAYVLDFKSRGNSSTVRGRVGIIVTAIGEDRLTLLEILGLENSTFDVGERIYIGKEGRTKVQSVLGKIDYAKISDAAQSEIPGVVESIIIKNEKRFVDYPWVYARDIISSSINYSGETMPPPELPSMRIFKGSSS